uniref:Uncharacterized protein n=1 Tax=Haptolina brevifila TaxID=156173 RepID=A0A7S2JJF5_9EUKA
MYSAGDTPDNNPLLTALIFLKEKLPRVLWKRWDAVDDLTEHDRGEIAFIEAARNTNKGGRPASAYLAQVCGPTAARTFYVAGANLHADYLQHIQCPLQSTFSSAVPSPAAIDAIKALNTPVMEIGAGSGYWGLMLKANGVECVLYDKQPAARDTMSSSGYYRAWTEVAKGTHEKAAAHPTHALMLVWPFFHEDALPDSKDAWDLKALNAYEGSTVIHVGELAEQADNQTTSTSFKRRLAEEFTLAQTVDLPNWPYSYDNLTIWTRRESKGTVV